MYGVAAFNFYCPGIGRRVGWLDKMHPYVYMKSTSYISQYLDNWQVETFVFLAIWTVLTLLQMVFLRKEYQFAMFHSFFIAGLVSIS